MIHALIGMKRGEGRMVSIHPRYGYGEKAFFSPNSAIIAKIQLLDFQEQDEEVAISPPYELEMKNIKEMQARLEELKFEEYYQNGKNLWHAIKKTGDFIDLQIVKKSIEEIFTTNKKSIFSLVTEASNYSIDLQQFLLSRKMETETAQKEVQACP